VGSGCLRKSTTSIRGKTAGALQAAYQRGVEARGVATCLCLGAGHGKQCCSGDEKRGLSVDCNFLSWRYGGRGPVLGPAALGAISLRERYAVFPKEHV